MEEQDTNINNTQRIFRWITDSLYPVGRDRPRSMAELAERVVREVKDLRSRASQDGHMVSLAHKLEQMRGEQERLRQQVDGLTAANSELGLLLRRPTEEELHKGAEKAMAMIRKNLSGGVIVGVVKDEDKATFGIVVHLPTGQHVHLWLYKDDRKVGPALIEIDEDCDA